MSLSGPLRGLLDESIGFIGENPISSVGVAIGGGAVAGAVAGFFFGKRKKKNSKTKRGTRRDRKFISKQKHERAYIKRKQRAGKRITRKRYKTSKSKSKKRLGKTYYTKKGQPYKILSSGKARFIKKGKK